MAALMMTSLDNRTLQKKQLKSCPPLAQKLFVGIKISFLQICKNVCTAIQVFYLVERRMMQSCTKVLSDCYYSVVVLNIDAHWELETIISQN